MARGFYSELRRLAGFLVICALAGAILQLLIPGLLLGCVAFMAWHLWQMRLFGIWLSQQGQPPPVNLHGVWDEYAHQIQQQHARQAKERRRLQGMITRVQQTTAAQRDAVILLHSDYTIQWWNQSAHQLLGLRNEDNGKPVFNYIRSPKFVRYLEKGQFTEPLVLASSVDADLFLNYQVSQFGQGEYLVVVRDVSRVQKLEQMRKDFIGNVSHELRTPLTVVRGYLETMSDNSDSLPPVWQKAIGQMESQSKRMTLLIEDLLTLTRLETEDTDYKQTDVDVTALLNLIKTDATGLSGEDGHQVVVDIQHPITLKGVYEELRSCLSNLAFNAIRYSPPGSDIILRARITDEEAIIEVQDHGIGIDAHHIPRLTERFYRVEKSRSLDTGGTGLGLAIVKHVLAHHQGQLRIESRINQGSTFACVFPISRIVDSTASSLPGTEAELNTIDSSD
ncbi:phosphate regulon sensor histidine kinase PhoR [Halioxenophilus aromaticivorans]|uniref:histidine kinase n=1 Tax=Halioxenophilus aromaticivorans TaxID=1306992 RepID=A0AAV3TXD1_9ALTE